MPTAGPSPGPCSWSTGPPGTAWPLQQVNVRLAAIRKLVTEARANGMLSAEDAAQLTEVPNVRQRGTRLGNWLTRELLQVPDRETLKGKRDYAILALLVGCALRRRELAQVYIEDLQVRENRWVSADLRGKDGRIRTVAVPVWVREGIDAWMAEAKLEKGPLLRSITKGGRVGEPDRLGHLGRGHLGGQGDRHRALRSPWPPPYLCEALPQGRRGSGADQVPARTLVYPDDRTVPGAEQEVAVAVYDSLGP